MNYFAYPHQGAWAVVYIVPGTMAVHVHEVGFARLELAKARASELNGRPGLFWPRVQNVMGATA